MSTEEQITIEQRRKALDDAVRHWVKRGYVVQSRSDTTAQIVKHKKFSFLWALLWFLLLGVGLLIYLIYYWAKRDKTVYVEVDAKGKVHETKK
jgi:uncharacterized membrane protein